MSAGGKELFSAQIEANKRETMARGTCNSVSVHEETYLVVARLGRKGGAKAIHHDRNNASWTTMQGKTIALRN
jgi:hypothetical protein